MSRMGRIRIAALNAMVRTDIEILENRFVRQSLNPPGNMGTINLRHDHSKALYQGRIKQPPRYVSRSGRRLGR